MAGSRTVRVLVIPEDQPLLARHGDRRRPGGGRDLMIGESLKKLPLLYRLCPELKSLRERIAELLTDR